jgi:hypothetical protein
MKPTITILLFPFVLLSSCMNTLYRNLPEGTYSSGDHQMVLDPDGSFILENFSNVNDGRNFSIEGTYASSRDQIDQDNDSYGTITFDVLNLFLEGVQVTSLYLDEDGESEASKVQSGDRLEGWWAYSENITWGGMMRIWFNWPGIPRGNNFYDGHNELFSGDP